MAPATMVVVRPNISSINELKVRKGLRRFYSTPETYFKEAHADKSLSLPTIKDDLQHHAVGCYSRI